MNFGLHHRHNDLSLTSHFYGVALLANRTWFEALAPATQSALLAASAKATAAQRQLAIAEDALCLEQPRRDGVAVVSAEEIDMAAFRAAVAGLGN
jgi:TRAP-type C4-dicarboxylate transport system substrate-binding protein